ncbi:MAG: MerR family transcriptional regulator [Baekduia sp.]
MADSRASAIDLSGPQLRGNHRGYHLGDEVVDGFPDQPQLPPFQRRLIAEWAKALDHELSAAQQVLLQTRPTPPEAQLQILRAAHRDGDHDVPRLVESGVYETLDAADIDRCEWPEEVLGEARSYPVNATELATLAGVTYKQIRDWDKGGLLPSHDVDGRRQYFSAAALTACALKPLDRWQIAALRGVLSADRDSGFRRLIDYVSV